MLKSPKNPEMDILLFVPFLPLWSQQE